MPAPPFLPLYAAPLGWGSDPQPSPAPPVTTFATICVPERLATSGPSSPSSGTFTPSSDTSPPSRLSSQDAPLSPKTEDSFNSDADVFWSQWIHDCLGTTELENTVPSSSDVTIREAHSRTTAYTAESSPECPETAPPQATFTAAAATFTSHTAPSWPFPPAPFADDLHGQSYFTSFAASADLASSYPPIQALNQDVQMPVGGSLGPSPPPVHVVSSSAIIPTCTTPWTSRAFPRSSRCSGVSRDGSVRARKAQTGFIPSSPRSCYPARSFTSCPWQSGPPVRNLALHHLSRRSYSSTGPTSPPLKRKRDGTSEGDGKQAPPKRSELRPPKQAPSVWQIYFTDWLEQKKSRGFQDGDGEKKLNVAQAAKEAGQQYNKLSDEEREELKRRALVLKEKYERDCAAWKRTLTPEDIARENAFRAAQRRSGKSRRKNINDPNAPKRPLSAYFLFLQRIRGDPVLVREVFGEETETTRQSVLAAAKWRSMSDGEKKPYFDQAENAKLEYEADRKAYEDQTRENSTVSSVVFYLPSSGHPEEHGGGDGILSDSGGADSS